MAGTPEDQDREASEQDRPREGGSFSWERCPVCGNGANGGYGGMLFYPKA